MFFGVGAGRCGTMALANALSLERGVVCTHEGKRRDFEKAGEQLLPFLTLQNRLAYEEPERAQSLFDAARAQMPRIGAALAAERFGDIAYNYAPFIPAITHRFPDARLIVLVRSGIDFVRSATEPSGTDETPVGWAPRDRTLSAVERFVELGRLAPRATNPVAARWGDMDHFARNAWLWAETQRLIRDGIARRAPGTTLVVRFETFFADVAANYSRIREFLELPPGGDAAIDRLRTPINRRAEKAFGPPSTWTRAQHERFDELAGPMMRELDYPVG